MIPPAQPEFGDAKVVRSMVSASLLLALHELAAAARATQRAGPADRAWISAPIWLFLRRSSQVLRKYARFPTLAIS